MFYSYNDKRTEREKQLEWELDDLRQEKERLDRQQREERENRLQEMRIIHEENMRTADSWPEALQKQSYLFRREANMFPEETDQDDFFAPGADACEFALKVWQGEEENSKEEIATLLAKIEEINTALRMRVADRVEAEHPDNVGWKMVAQAIREDNYNNWLYW